MGFERKLRTGHLSALTITAVFHAWISPIPSDNSAGHMSACAYHRAAIGMVSVRQQPDGGGAPGVPPVGPVRQVPRLSSPGLVGRLSQCPAIGWGLGVARQALRDAPVCMLVLLSLPFLLLVRAPRAR